MRLRFWVSSLSFLAFICAPRAALAYAVVVPEAESCIRVGSGSVVLTVGDDASESVATTMFSVDADQTAHLVVPVIGDGKRAPSAVLDGTPIALSHFDAATAGSFLSERVLARKTPALIALAGLELHVARVELAAGQHTLVTTSEPNVDRAAPVPRVLEPLRNFDTACTAHAIDIDATITSAVPIGAVFTPFHNRQLERPESTIARVRVSASPDESCHDFHLYLSTSNEKVAAGALSYRDASCGDDGPGYLLIGAGPTTLRAEEAVAKDFVAVIDTSGSMGGEKIEQVRAAMLSILDRLQPEDRFDLVTFSSNAQSIFGELRSASDSAALEQARGVVRGMHADGSTNINAALLMGLGELQRMSSGRPRLILFLTDGEATEGVTATDQILSNVAQANESQVRIYPFGVGDNVNTSLLDGLGRQTGSVPHYIRPGADIDAILADFYAEIQAPVATDVELETTGISLRDRLPAELPDLFVGTNVFALSRYDLGSGAQLSLLGTTGSGRERFSVAGNILSQGTGHAFLPRLWASRLLGELLIEARENGGAEETVNRIRELAELHGFVTRWTPLIMDESGEVDREYQNPTGDQTGSDAVGTSAAINDISNNSNAGAYSAGGGGQSPIRQILDRTFVRTKGYWTDTRAPKELGDVIDVHFGSEAWFELVRSSGELRELLAIGRSVIVEWRCRIVRVTNTSLEGIEVPSEDPLPAELLAPGEEQALERWPDPTGLPEELKPAKPTCQAALGTADVWMLLGGAVLLMIGIRRRRTWSPGSAKVRG